MAADDCRHTFDCQRAIVFLIAGGAALRLAFAATTGLGVDETYMVAVGRHWELGYFDHPPLAWWLSRAASLALGSEANWIVRAPFIALFGLSTWLMWRLTRELFGEAAGFLAAFALNCAPVLGVTTGSWVLPDGPLDAALLAGALCLSRLLLAPSPPPALWLLAGAFGGLATLSKFHGVFLFAGAGLFLLTSPRQRGWLATPWPYLGALLALAIVSPAIVWNAQHGWASLAFQGARAATKTLRPWMPLVALAGQAAYLAPWIWAPLAAAAWTYGRKPTQDPAAWLLICLGVGPIAFFTLVAAWSDQKPYFHWAAPGYLLLFPLLGRYLAGAFEAGSKTVRWWLKGSAAFVLTAMAAVAGLTAFPQIAASLGVGISDPLAELIDWTDAAAYLRQQGVLGGPRAYVVARRWYEAAKIDYALHGALDVVCVGDDCRGYDFVAPRQDLTGDNAIVMVPDNAPASALEAIRPRFASLDPMPPLTISHGPFTVARFDVYRASPLQPAAK